MPVSWDWTYQLNQYELCYPDDPKCLNDTTNSHRLSWGSNYGALGGAKPGSGSYPAYGDDRQLSGYPYQSYSVFMVLGKHSDTPVFNQVAEIETVQGTHLTAAIGSVKAMGPGGVGRNDLVPLAPAGYDHRYAVWWAEASAGKLSLHVTIDRGTLTNPVLVVGSYTGTAPVVTIDGAAATADVGYLASIDAATHQLWITIRGAWTGSHDLKIE